MVELKLDFNKLFVELDISANSSEYVNTLTGSFLSKFSGDGIEFDSFREYTPNDDSRKIDWVASAKAEKLFVRDFIEEKNANFFILFDSSFNGFFGSEDKLKCEFGAEIAALLAFSMTDANERVGFAIFNNGIEKFINPNIGNAHFQIIINALKNSDLYGDYRDYNSTFKNLLSRIKEKTILFIISDFLNFTEDNVNFLKLLGSKFEVHGIMVRDIREAKLSTESGLICIEDIRTYKQLILNPSNIREEYEEEMLKDELYVSNIFLKNNMNFKKLYSNENPVRGLINYFLDKKWN